MYQYIFLYIYEKICFRGSFYNPHEGSMLITDVTNGEVLKKLEKNFEGNVV